jgi:hypothetical protein
VLASAIKRAWDQAPESLSFLRNELIEPYLPSELQPDTRQSVVQLMDLTHEFYETEKALRVAYTVVSTRKLSITIERVFQENSAPLEMEKKLRTAFAELAHLEVLMRRYSEEDDVDNKLSLSPIMDVMSLRSPGGGGRVKAVTGGDLDISLGGGLEEGTYTILLGSKGEGKTWVTSCVAAHNARIGRNVLFFTLENSKYSIAQRTYPLYLQFPFFVASFRNFTQTLVRTGATIITKNVVQRVVDAELDGTGDLLLREWKNIFLKRIEDFNGPLPVLQAMDLLQDPFYESLEILKKFREEQLLGRLDIRFFPANSLKISDIEREIETSDVHYSLIIVDYLNAVMVPPETPRHEFLGWFANEIRRLSSETRCASWINAQLKRGFKLYSKTISKGGSGIDEEAFYEFVAESFAAVWGADYVVVLLMNPIVHKHVQTGYVQHERALLLNRAREVICGDWFSFNVDFKKGVYDIRKLTI